MLKGFQARLYPTRAQEEILNQTFGCCRFVYNYFLAERTRLYREDGTSMNFAGTCKALTMLKREKDCIWLNTVDSAALQQSLKNLDRAYQNFFKNRARFPKFHRKSGRQSYHTTNTGNRIRIEGRKVRIPKVGFVKMRGLRPFEGRIVSATISKSASGKFFISLCVEMEDIKLPNAGGIVGIDVGIKEFYTASNGKVVENPRTYRKHEEKLIREQRRLSRKKKGSKNFQKQKKRLVIQHEKVANIRRDFLHKQTRALASENQVVCVENLNVKGMLKNHHLAKAVSDVSWSEFFRQLEYKTAEHGGVLVKVPTFFPSSQTCSNCGFKNVAVKNLAVREWVCPECGARHDRDENAAKNILKEGLKILES